MTAGNAIGNAEGMAEAGGKKSGDPMVSIIMPTYNGEQYLEEAVESVLRQSWPDWELIIVDDCSGDSTPDIIKAYAQRDARIRHYRLETNSGSPARPRNVGIDMARGNYIAFLDADDTWVSCKLERQLDFMMKKGASFSCTGYYVTDATGDVRGAFLPPQLCRYEDLLRENTIGCLTGMYDVRIYGKMHFPYCGHEDYALWLRFLRDGGEVYGLTERLAYYRKATGSVSNNKFRVVRYFWNIYRNQEGFSVIRSAYYCLRYAYNVRQKYFDRSLDVEVSI